MAVTFGFYNSVNHDRQYSAEQMGSLFDGIIKDGIYQAYGKAFAVSAESGLSVTVGIGRAWFDHTWTLNDSPLNLPLVQADLLLSRIDTVVIEVNRSTENRKNSIKVVQGTKASSPVAPTLSTSGDIKQYPLANISVAPAQTTVTSSDITNRRGTSATPWVTGPLTIMDATNLYNTWMSQWTAWFSETKALNDQTVKQFVATSNSEFLSWFSDIKATLDGDAAAALASRVVALENKIQASSDGQIIFDDIMDSSGNSVLDSSGHTIQGKLIYVLA